MQVLGLMTGTSMDGVDLALIETDGTNLTRTHKYLYQPFNSKLQQAIIDACAKKQDNSDLGEALALTQIAAIEEFFNQHRLNKLPDLLGIPGQTIYHNAKLGISIASTNQQRIADYFSIPVVGDFRINDIKEGGQGAPLMPIYLKSLAQSLKLNLPICFINLGGVASLCYIDNTRLIGFDIGFANGLSDRIISTRTNLSFDKNGEIAATGQIDDKVVQQFLSHDYYCKSWPKSLDRNDFSLEYFQNLDLPSALATAGKITSESINIALQSLPSPNADVYLYGGGMKNKFLLNLICSLALNIKEHPEIIYGSDFLEAEGFAYLASRSFLNLPLSYPDTTGVKTATSGGRIYLPNFLRLVL